jgi:hypothetical protein
MAVQAGEGLLDHVLGRRGLVDQQQGQPDQAHSMRSVQVFQGQRGRGHLRDGAAVDRAQPGERVLDAALGIVLRAGPRGLATGHLLRLWVTTAVSAKTCHGPERIGPQKKSQRPTTGNTSHLRVHRG